jgi:putative addiction module killer protein
MLEAVEYTDARGVSVFSAWRNRLDTTTRARVTVAVFKLLDGNDSSAKSIGGSLYELRLNFGPGYRVYFARDGETLVILLGGGTKKRQQSDISAAKVAWQLYLRDKAVTDGKRKDRHKKV